VCVEVCLVAWFHRVGFQVVQLLARLFFKQFLANGFLEPASHLPLDIPIAHCIAYDSSSQIIVSTILIPKKFRALRVFRGQKKRALRGQKISCPPCLSWTKKSSPWWTKNFVPFVSFVDKKTSPSRTKKSSPSRTKNFVSFVSFVDKKIEPLVDKKNRAFRGQN